MENNFVIGSLWGSLFVVICVILPIITYFFKILTQKLIGGIKSGERNQ